MRLCKMAVDYLQIINAEGEIRVCGWRKNNKNIIGSLLEQDIHEILKGEKAADIRRMMASGDYSNCSIDNCPYLSNNKMEDILIDVEEIPEYPSELHLAYEGVCNYQCTCCSSYQHMKDTRKYDFSRKYDLLEQKLKEILPHVKILGANGRGELFASKRILKLLQEWKPLAPAEEIEVRLETNGSMFDEKHWRQIENLGQYRLLVTITVMSFEEKVYQHLSGTKLPISKIEENLRYVKKLRNDGIINFVEIATVLQEENFREMPEFTRRCLEEFGADKVRIRPIFPGGIYDHNIQWFMDVRNPEHPYYEQYREVMRHPVFQDPRVLLWSGNLPSTMGKHPGIKAENIQHAIDLLLSEPDLIEKIKQQMEIDQSGVYLYGIGTLGKLVLNLNNGRLPIKGIYDKFSSLQEWKGIPVRRPDCVNGKKESILCTVYGQGEMVRKELTESGFAGKVYDLYSLLKEERICENL